MSALNAGAQGGLKSPSKKKEKKSGLPFYGLPKIWPMVRPYKADILMIVAAALIESGCDVARPVLQKYALNHYVQGGSLDTIVPFALVYLAVVLLGGLGVVLGVKYSTSTEVRINRDLRNAAFSKLQKLSFDYYNQNSVGYIHSRVMSDTSVIGDLFTNQVSDTALLAITIVGSMSVMLASDAKLALMVLAILPVVALLFSFFEKRVFDLHRQVREINSKITGNFNEGIVGAKTIKSLAVEERIGSDFREETARMRSKSVESARARGVCSMISNLAASTAMALILWKGGVIAAEDVGTFSMFMSYVQRMMQPVRWLVDTLVIFVQGEVNIDRYCRLMETEPSVKDSPEVEALYGDCFEPKRGNWEEIRGDIELSHVDFKYPDGEEYILEDFCLKIPFGTSVAIVGETGAGKSTLANLVCRFYEPTRGQVLIDGRDARERSQLWLHSALGYVLQSPQLFSGTIRDNLRFGKEDATDAEIMEALDLVSARGVVERLEKGLDTDVGEGGDLLSTGEKQLICFARAVLADPKILVLDEATASVDTLTEQRIQAAIGKVIKGRTSIVIAHRLSTVVDSDIILVVNDGKIIERGRHEELLAAGGHYSRLWKRQYEDEAISAVWEQRAGAM